MAYRWELDVGDISEDEDTSFEGEMKEAIGRGQTGEKLIMMVSKVASILNMEVPLYDRNLSLDELLD